MLPLAAFIAGCSDSKPHSTDEFTRIFADRLRAREPTVQVETKAALHLTLSDAQKKGHVVFLDNAYNEYKHDPTKVEQVVDRYSAAALESFKLGDAPIDQSKIVPVIKDRGYLEEARHALSARGVDTAKFDQYYEDFNGQLIVMYGVDTPQTIKYLQTKDLRDLKLDATTLRSSAVKNLLSILPSIQRHGSDGTYMITAGGTYEASLLLCDKIWHSDMFKVKGELVAAVPARDMLLVTGSKDDNGLKSVREIVAKTMRNGAYHLTAQLFVYRNGKFVAFDE